MGLGWLSDVSRASRNGVDLDAAVAVFDSKGEHLEDVYFGRQTGFDGAVVHRDGGGGGDNEVISINLGRLPAAVHTLLFTVSVYAGGSFHDVREAHCRLIDVDADNMELCRFTFSQTETLDCGALILTGMVRQGSSWVVQARGESAAGRTVRANRTQLEGIARTCSSTVESAGAKSRLSFGHRTTSEGSVSRVSARLTSELLQLQSSLEPAPTPPIGSSGEAFEPAAHAMFGLREVSAISPPSSGAASPWESDDIVAWREQAP